MTSNELLGYVKSPYNKQLLEVARKKAKLMTMYVTGEGLINHIEALPYFEKDELTQLRRKLSRTTVDLFDRLLAPTEKVFTARGGFESYGLPTPKETQFKRYLSSIRNGLSLKEWIQHVSFKAKLVDPMSITFIELDQDGNAYPTYKSSNSIHDYKLKGRYLEYVIFSMTKDEINLLINQGVITNYQNEKIYRAVDNYFEYYISDNDKEIKVLQVFHNPFLYVPALINGDNLTFNSDYIGSELESIMELVADFFNDNSSKSLFKKYQMHAKEWSVEVSCSTCHGEGVMGGESCGHCGGTGQEPSVKVAQSLRIGMNEDGSMKSPTPPLGYVTPPIESWNMINEELDRIKKDIYDTFYDNQVGLQTAGIAFNQKTGGEQRTATEVVINEKHKEPTLRKFTKWANDMHRFIADNIKFMMYNYTSTSSVNYGDKYMLIDTNEIINTYQILRKDGAPVTVLDDALLDIYESQFATNPLQLHKHILLMKVEPLVHYSLADVLTWNIAPELKDMKLFYGEWSTSMDDIQIVSQTEEQLRQSLKVYVQNKMKEYPTPIIEPTPTPKPKYVQPVPQK